MIIPDKIYINKHRYYEDQLDIEWGEDRIHDDDIEYTRSDLIPTWKPISEAPRDWTKMLLLLKWDDIPIIGYWNVNNKRFEVYTEYIYVNGDASLETKLDEEEIKAFIELPIILKYRCINS